MSLSETNLDSFMRIFINGPDTFKMLQYFFYFFWGIFQKTENFEELYCEVIIFFIDFQQKLKHFTSANFTPRFLQQKNLQLLWLL